MIRRVTETCPEQRLVLEIIGFMEVQPGGFDIRSNEKVEFSSVVEMTFEEWEAVNHIPELVNP